MSIGSAFGGVSQVARAVRRRGLRRGGLRPAGLRHPLARTQVLQWEPQDVRVQLISWGYRSPSNLLLLFLVAR